MVRVGLSDDDDMIESEEELGVSVVSQQKKLALMDEDLDSDDGDSEELSGASAETGPSRRGVGDSDEGFDDNEHEEEEEEEEEDLEDLDNDLMEEDALFFPSAALSDSMVGMPAVPGLDSSRVQIMNSLFFGAEYRDEDGIRRVAKLDSRPRSALMMRSIASPVHHPQQQELQPQQQSGILPSRQISFARPLVINTATLICPPSERLGARLNLHNRSLQQHLDLKRLSFGVGFGPEGKMVVCGTSESEAHVASTRLRGESSTKAAKAVLEQHRNQFWHMDPNELEQRADGFVKQLTQIEAVDEYERSCWELVDVLWGTVEENRDPNPHKESVVRRRLLCDWVAASTRADTERGVAAAGANVPGQILALLSGRRVKDALRVCMENNRLRLAAIIASCADTHESKLCLAQQKWEHVQQDELAVMQLLSGGSDAFFASSGFDWLRAFGAFLWYRFAPDQPISGVFRAFRLFLERTGVKVTDFRFNLLHVFSEPRLPASQILLPESYGSNPINWRLAYMTRSALAHLPQRESGRRIVLPLASDAATSVRLSLRFAEQLEAMGLWQWAVYVFLSEQHVPEAIRQRSVRDVILRSCGSASQREEGEQFVQSLGLSWLAEALRSARDLYEASTTTAPARATWTDPATDFGSIDSYLKKYHAVI